MLQQDNKLPDHPHHPALILVEIILLHLQIAFYYNEQSLVKIYTVDC